MYWSSRNTWVSC